MKQLFVQYRNRLFYYIARFTKSELVAEELVMDVFMKIWSGRELLTQVDNFDAFLFRIARNKSIDFLRSAAGNTRFQELLLEQLDLVSTDYADTALLTREYEEKVREAVMLLSPQRRKVYTLRHEQHLSQAEIAAQLNLSRHTVNNHIVEAQRLVLKHVASSMDLAVLLLVIKLTH